MNNILSVQDLVLAYGKSVAVSGVDLVVKRNSVTALLGPNGAGKSSLLKGIMGVVRPRSGSVTFESRDLLKEKADRLIKRGIGYSPEGRRVFPTMTVEENLLLAGLNVSRETRKIQHELCLELFPDLAARLAQLGGTLSGGQQQMLAVSRAIMSAPHLLILDEPSLGVSPKLTQEVYNALAILSKQGLSILLVEQYAHLALNISSYTYVMNRGLIVAEGDSDRIKNDTDVMSSYLG